MEWLVAQLEGAGADVLFAYVYGSALQKRKPRDFDVIIVTSAGVESAAWSRVRVLCKRLRPEFAATFGLPLSVMIATEAEWSEIDGVVVRERALVYFT